MMNVLKRAMGSMDDQAGATRHAIVAAVNPNDHTVRVTLDDAGTLSGWLPMVHMAGGGGWSGVCLPQPGQQVFMAPDMGDQSHGVVLGIVPSSLNPPGQVTPYGDGAKPQPFTPGEITFQHPSGASFRLTKGGVIESRGTWKHMGDLLVHGDIRDQDGQHGTLAELRNDYDQHQHTDVKTGSDTSGPPTKVTP